MFGYSDRQVSFCDLTQSYSAKGGGVRTFLTEKRVFINRNSIHRHILIIPGARDKIFHEGRHITIEIASPKVPNSPNYRLLLRSRAVLEALRKLKPDFVECHDAYNLPWTAINFRREHPETFLSAIYHTDFPKVYIEAYSRKLIGQRGAKKLRSRAYAYATHLYQQFDRFLVLNQLMADQLSKFGMRNVDILTMGTDIELFHPDKRDEGLRNSFGDKPILIYSGRLDREKQADVVLDAFLRLPDNFPAHLIFAGDGNLKHQLQKQAEGQPVSFTGYVRDRERLAKLLASSDLYVSAMAHETFGLSVIEAQASGLPVVGVNAGAMPDRVSNEVGFLGPVSDADAMAQNIQKLWLSGRAQKMGLKARARVVKDYSWDQTFQALFYNAYRKNSGNNYLVEAA